MQPVIIVEGTQDGGGRALPDRKLYRALHAGFDRTTLIAGGGKAECIALARSLSPALAEFSTLLKVIALLDQDVERRDDELCVSLTVSMSENFFIDPDVLFEAIESVLDRTEFRTVEDVAAALDALLTASEPQEVNRRALARLGPSHFHPGPNTEELPRRAVMFLEETRERYSEDAIREARRVAEAVVADIRARHRRREEFDGKKLLQSFWREHLTEMQLSRSVFAFYAAKRARRRRSVVKFFDRFFEDQRIIARGETPRA